MKYKSNEQPKNITQKPLSEFTSEDTIYIQKIESGFMASYLCQFISLNRGIVTARIIGMEKHSHPKKDVGDVITARPSKCYLYGNTDGEMNGGRIWNRCHWFKNTKDGVS